MIFKTFIAGMVLVGITFILTELHRYQVYKTDIEREEEHDPRLDKEPTDEEMKIIVNRYIDDPDDVMPLVE